jgi:hypothetical protein
LLEFTLQRVRHPHKLKLELQLPDDAAPMELVILSEHKNYKYSAPTALDTANPF